MTPPLARVIMVDKEEDDEALLGTYTHITPRQGLNLKGRRQCLCRVWHRLIAVSASLGPLNSHHARLCTFDGEPNTAPGSAKLVLVGPLGIESVTASLLRDCLIGPVRPMQSARPGRLRSAALCRRIVVGPPVPFVLVGRIDMGPDGAHESAERLWFPVTLCWRRCLSGIYRRCIGDASHARQSITPM
jgi:hypothetical protein